MEIKIPNLLLKNSFVSNVFTKYESSYPEVFCKESVSQNLLKNTCVGISKVAGLYRTPLVSASEKISQSYFEKTS